MGDRGSVLRPRCIGPGRAGTQIPFNSIQFNVPMVINNCFVIYATTEDVQDENVLNVFVTEHKNVGKSKSSSGDTAGK
jgi:hypothetical protein